MRIHSPTRSSRHAIAAVEMALISPLLISLLVGVWEVGRLIHVQKIVDNAAREGGRQASTGRKTIPQVQQDVRDYLKNAGMPITHVQVSVANLSSASACRPAAECPSGDPVQCACYTNDLKVAVTLPMRDVRWIALNWFVPDNALIQSAKTWTSMVNKPLVVNQNPPLQPLQ